MRMRREDVSVNLNGMLERVIVGSLTVRDTISVVVCGQKGSSWKEGRWGGKGSEERERGEEGKKKKGRGGGGDGRKEGGRNEEGIQKI